MTHIIREVIMTRAMMYEAEVMAEELGVLRNSITNGGGNLAGFYGEVALAHYAMQYGAAVAHNNTYDYDLTIGPYRIDVKTKRCTSAPRPMYECSVADFNTTQKCDKYAFTRVHGNTVYLCGIIDKEEYYKLATFHKKGETDTNIVRGKPFTFHADCYNLRINQLGEFK